MTEFLEIIYKSIVLQTCNFRKSATKTWNVGSDTLCRLSIFEGWTWQTKFEGCTEAISRWTSSSTRGTLLIVQLVLRLLKICLYTEFQRRSSWTGWDPSVHIQVECFREKWFSDTPCKSVQFIHDVGSKCFEGCKFLKDELEIVKLGNMWKALNGAPLESRGGLCL